MKNEFYSYSWSKFHSSFFFSERIRLHLSIEESLDVTLRRLLEFLIPFLKGSELIEGRKEGIDMMTILVEMVSEFLSCHPMCS